MQWGSGSPSRRSRPRKDEAYPGKTENGGWHCPGSGIRYTGECPYLGRVAYIMSTSGHHDARNPLLLSPIGARIHTVRGQAVMLDSDLAEVYGVQTSRINEAVKRNPKRFAPAYSFQLDKK